MAATCCIDSHLVLQRPWLSLYGNRLRVPVVDEQFQLAPIQEHIPPELMLFILSKLDPYSLGKASAVCRQWRILSEHPRLWEQACHEAFRLSIPDKAARHRLMAAQHRFSWKRMFLDQPHLRFDGIYVARNTYVRTGVVDLYNRQPVHLVAYYRYFRFFPDGTFLYRTSPNVLSKVAPSLAVSPGLLITAPAGAPAAPAASGQQGPPGGGGGGGSGGGALAVLPRNTHAAAGGGGREGRHVDKERGSVLVGRYVLEEDGEVRSALLYPNSNGTELRCRMQLRSSVRGAHNRLDIVTITTYDREAGMEAAVAGQPDGGANEEEDANGNVKTHKRGLSPCIFVVWEDVHSSPLNLPPHKMDFMIA